MVKINNFVFITLLLTYVVWFAHGWRQSDGIEELIDLYKRDSATYRRQYSRKRNIICSRQLPSKKQCTVSYNGCGSAGMKKTWLPFKKTFTPSCNRHDVCYGCGGWRSWSRKNCDKKFLSDMRKACRCKHRRSRQCLFWARTFYITVRAAGWKFYVKNKPLQRSWCLNSCVIPFGSPIYYV